MRQLIVASLLLSCPLAALAQQAPLNCDIGPITRTFGGTQWLVYSCRDNRSVVVFSAPGNPAMPFYFMFSPSGQGYRLVGEGTGQKQFTEAALKDLSKLVEQDILKLVAETKLGK
jgi:hypothetical protein